MAKCQKDPTCGIFLKRRLFKDIKNYIPIGQMRKYKNTNTKYTNTQIQHMTKCQKDPTCGIFSKRGLFKDIKNYITIGQMCKDKDTNTKYTNTAYGKVPKRPNMWYIFERKKMVCSRISKIISPLFKCANTKIQIHKYSI